ncbi:MAG: hypothetical protein ACYCT7_03350 [bacterium]
MEQKELLAIWKPKKEDIVPILLIALLPILMAMPELIGWLKANPIIVFGYIATKVQSGIIPWPPYIDPSNAFVTQAEGYRAAIDWIHGIIPWWNPFSGVGLPLAAEYQSLAFFPLTLLLLLPKGMILEHLMLQILAGWGTYALLRQLRIGRLAAFTGGMLFGFNGSLALFDFAAVMPVPFLPWVLLGIEHARVKAQEHSRGGWRLLAVSMAILFLAGGPETAYICGLLVLAWTLLRFYQSSSTARAGFFWRASFGGLIGVGIAAPQLLAFFEFLPPLGYIGMHAGSTGYLYLPPIDFIPTLLFPYIYGPINALSTGMWASFGGYVDILLLSMAVYGLIAKRGPLSLLLGAWIVLALAKTFGFYPVVVLWNLIPGITDVAFNRYAQPSWEFAVILLAAFGLNEMNKTRKVNAIALLGAAQVPLFFIILLLIYGSALIPTHLSANAEILHWAIGSAVWAGLTIIELFLFVLLVKPLWRGRVIAILLIVDSMATFVIPTLANPQHGSVDMPAIHFLQKHIGLQRFYTVGPIYANLGAYFGIASINETYTPVASRWVMWLKSHLNPNAHPTNFILMGDNQQSFASELRKRLYWYEWAGVKYAVAPAGVNPLYRTTPSTQVATTGNIPLPLLSGQSATGVIPATMISQKVIYKVGVFQGNYGDTANGIMQVKICSANSCASGNAKLSTSHDNTVFWIQLQTPLIIRAHGPLYYRFTHLSGNKPDALWVWPVATNAQQNLVGPSGGLKGGLEIYLSSIQGTFHKVYSDSLMTIYELPHPKPYYRVYDGECTLKSATRDSLIADCVTPSRLVRRELYFPGWIAYVNGQPTNIADYNGLFQSIKLTRGKNDIYFSYAPPYINWAWLIMWISLATWVTSYFWQPKKGWQKAAVSKIKQIKNNK